MEKSKLSFVEVTFDGTDKMNIDVRFKNVDVVLGDGGLAFHSDGKLKAQWAECKYKLVRTDEYILLEKVNTGGKKIVSSKAYDYYDRFPIYGDAVDVVYDRYGKLFRIEAENDNIKLFPIFIEETKLVRAEINEAIMRYLARTT